jgi:hypothetical protein
MNDSKKPPLWFWIVGVLLLAWNLLGVMAYVGQATMSPEALQAMPAAERELTLSRPAWATAAFAIAVFGGAAGCLLLLLRSRWALPVLVLSFIGVAVQMFHAFAIADSIAVYGPGGAVMPAMVVVVSILLIWLARRARKRGWLR